MTRTQAKLSRAAGAFIWHGGRAITALARLGLLAVATMAESVSRALVAVDGWLSRQSEAEKGEEKVTVKMV
jgi:hypothetical protein